MFWTVVRSVVFAAEATVMPAGATIMPPGTAAERSDGCGTRIRKRSESGCVKTQKFPQRRTTGILHCGSVGLMADRKPIRG